ncbi:MAG: DUF6134 family protein [Bacteroidota bacterium]
MLTLLLSAFLLIQAPTEKPTLERNLTYEVFSDDEHIGEIKASYREENGTRTYEMQTDVTYKVLFKTIRFDNRITSRYQDDVLTEASSTDHLNDKPRSENRIEHKGDHYLVFEKDKSERLEESSIQNCLSSLYFSEPKGLKSVFSQRLGKLIPMEEAEPHKYAVHLSSSKTNYYRFENGICVEVEVNHWFADFTFKLKR